MCYGVGVQPFYGIGPHLLLWAGSQAVREIITISGVPNHRNCCVNFVVYT
jgi:hypothetical protein